MMASTSVFAHSRTLVERAVFPAVARQRFVDQLQAECSPLVIDDGGLEIAGWTVRFLGEGSDQSAIVSGQMDGYTPFATGRESLMRLLAANGKHVKPRSGRYTCNFSLNHCDLELEFDVASRLLFDEQPDAVEDGFFVARQARIGGEGSYSDVRLYAERDWKQDRPGIFGIKPQTSGLEVIVSSESSSGLLGAVKSLLCRIRPAYVALNAVPWRQPELVRFLHDLHGRFGWRNQVAVQSVGNGMVLKIAVPFWLSAPGKNNHLAAEGEGFLALEYNQGLYPRVAGLPQLEKALGEHSFMVSQVADGLLLSWA